LERIAIVSGDGRWGGLRTLSGMTRVGIATLPAIRTMHAIAGTIPFASCSIVSTIRLNAFALKVGLTRVHLCLMQEGAAVEIRGPLQQRFNKAAQRNCIASGVGCGVLRTSQHI